MNTYQLLYEVIKDQNGKEISRKVLNRLTGEFEEFTEENYQQYVIQEKKSPKA